MNTETLQRAFIASAVLLWPRADGRKRVSPTRAARAARLYNKLALMTSRFSYRDIPGDPTREFRLALERGEIVLEAERRHAEQTPKATAFEFDDSDTKQLLTRLRRAIDHALDEALDAGIGGAINWGDLGCVETMLCVSEEGEITLRALIEEADPVNGELIDYVRERIGDWPYPVYITCEW